MTYGVGAPVEVPHVIATTMSNRATSLHQRTSWALAGCRKISFGERFFDTNSNDEESEEL
jgi:hypothetical protein